MQAVCICSCPAGDVFAKPDCNVADLFYSGNRRISELCSNQKIRLVWYF